MGNATGKMVDQGHLLLDCRVLQMPVQLTAQAGQLAVGGAQCRLQMPGFSHGVLDVDAAADPVQHLAVVVIDRRNTELVPTKSTAVIAQAVTVRALGWITVHGARQGNPGTGQVVRMHLAHIARVAGIEHLVGAVGVTIGGAIGPEDLALGCAQPDAVGQVVDYPCISQRHTGQGSIPGLLQGLLAGTGFDVWPEQQTLHIGGGGVIAGQRGKFNPQQAVRQRGQHHDLLLPAALGGFAQVGFTEHVRSSHHGMIFLQSQEG